MNTRIRRYSELILLPTFEERLAYLKIEDGFIGEETFGSNRWINQKFYTSYEYRKLRQTLVIRDKGCDMGLAGHPLPTKFYLHHMNPITIEDIVNHSEFAWNPEFLICVSFDTHQIIHFGRVESSIQQFASRSPNDMCPWRCG